MNQGLSKLSNRSALFELLQAHSSNNTMEYGSYGSGGSSKIVSAIPFIGKRIKIFLNINNLFYLLICAIPARNSPAICLWKNLKKLEQRLKRLILSAPATFVAIN